MGRFWSWVMALFGARRRRGRSRAPSQPGRPASATRAAPPARPSSVRVPSSADPPVRVPNEEALSADRVALIRDALVTHRAKRRLLDTLDGEDRSLLEALAFSALFFPSAGPDVLDAGAGARRPDATAPTQAPKAAGSGTRDPRP